MSIDKNKVTAREGISGDGKICTLQPFEVLRIIEDLTPTPEEPETPTGIEPVTPTPEEPYTPTYEETETPTGVEPITPTYAPTYTPTEEEPYTPTYTPTEEGGGGGFDPFKWLVNFFKWLLGLFGIKI